MGGTRAGAADRASCSSQFGLADAADRLVREYSGGMQRRLDVAMALVHKPAGALPRRADHRPRPRGAGGDVGGDRPARASEGLTVLLTTHYLEEADRLAAQLAIVDRAGSSPRARPDELKRELRGDAIHVELDADADEARCARRWRGSTGCARCWSTGRVAPRPRRGRRPHGPGGAGGARRRRLEVASVTVARPSLDDVYLRFAGRTFGAAEAGDRERPVQRKGAHH